MTASTQLSLMDQRGNVMPPRKNRADKGGKVLVHASAGKLVSTDFRRSNQGTLTPAFGTGQCICGQCGHGFASVSAFDKHQTLEGGELLCWDPASLGMARNARGWWVTELREDGAFSE